MENGVLVSTPDLRPSLLSILFGLRQSGRLSRVVTTLALGAGEAERVSRLPLLGRRLAGLVDRRRIPEFLDGSVDCLWSRELVRVGVSWIGRRDLAHRVWKWAEKGFDLAVAEGYGGRYPCVYGMEHSSAETFEAQKARGGVCVLRQVAAHSRTIDAVLKREADRFPEFVTPYYRLLLKDSEETVARKEREYELADLIVGNSEYARRTFLHHGVDGRKIVAIQTGCPPVEEAKACAVPERALLRFLYVGNISLRKGFPYLLEAWRKFELGSRANLWVAGPCEIPVIADILRSEEGICYLGTLPNQDLKELYRQADVLVLPTLCEGLAHSVLEALSFSLPVVTTPESGAGELVQDGQNGMVVPAGCFEPLGEAMERILACRVDLVEMGRRSGERARAWTVEKSNAAHLRAVERFLQGEGARR